MKLLRIISSLFLTLLLLLFSCAQSTEEIVINQTSGILKVSEVKIVNPRICSYKIESDDITSVNGNFIIECECDKFNANSILELVEIEEKTVDLKEKFYLIDSENNITIVNTNETNLDVETAIKNIQLQNINDSLKLFNQSLLIKKYKSKIDSLTKLTK